MSKKNSIFIIIAVLALTALGVYSNIREQRAVDHSKIPQKVEQSRGFQRWITNLKNNDIEVNADDFRLQEENEIYNTMWLKVYSMDDSEKKAEYEKTLKDYENIKKIVYSPSGREVLDFRNEIRGDYKANEVHFYGQKEDKIIDARIVDCSVRANCYFDRAYFLDNDVFVISEFSRNIDKKDMAAALCDVNTLCTYTIKLHVVDLIKNSRYVYESKPFDTILSELIPEL